MKNNYIVNFCQINLSDCEEVGGKNASIGEMMQNLNHLNINLPPGFAIKVNAYQDFMHENQLLTKIDKIFSDTTLSKLNKLSKACLQIKKLILKADFSKNFEQEVTKHYQSLGKKSVAVRSSAIAEDSKSTSFAGMQETYLNVVGIKKILEAIKLVYASLYTPRSINYRMHHGFSLSEFPISVGIMPMIRSDKGVSGVSFTLDSESGFDKVVVISASYGLGEAIVKGQVNPDEFIVYKPSLLAGKFSIIERKLGEKALMVVYNKTKSVEQSIKKVKVPLKKQKIFCLNDKSIEHIAYQSLLIEKYYGQPMDIEWASENGKIYILQARPETVISKKNNQAIERYYLKQSAKLLAEGQSIGRKIGQGKANIILKLSDSHLFKKGDVLITDMTDPDWEPIMKWASAIVTARGGRTCHAAIVARELGIPAVVGCSQITQVVKHQQAVTVACHDGLKGYIYDGMVPFDIKKSEINQLPALKNKMYLNVGSPEKAFECQKLPNDGVGLARIEFIISNQIGLHPNAALEWKCLPKALQKIILEKTLAYPSPKEFYIEKLREGMSQIAAAFDPKPVIFRFSDFKSNEYANLLGGELFEPKEENPMLGFRGACRYVHPSFKKCFELECIAVKRMRYQMGLTNAHVMLPFVRTIAELENVLAVMEEYGIKRGEKGLLIYMMCEVPSNVILIENFLKYVDGFSIGSNDLTQLILGLDRDSSLVAKLFDERDAAVKNMLHKTIAECKKQNKLIGICGQGPSDQPDFAKWLCEEGIDSMSLNPDAIVETWMNLAETEKY